MYVPFKPPFFVLLFPMLSRSFTLFPYTTLFRSDWDQLLPGIQFAMNTLNAKAHKKSPYYAVTGRESVMPAERLYNKKPTAEFESMEIYICL